MIVGQIQKGEKMGRTLNEDDVLKEIDRWIGYLDEDMITRIKIGIKKLQPAQPEQRWIPCSERLPENKSYVLTTIYVPGRQPHARSGWFEDGLFMNDNGDTWKSTDREVCAWLPLPAPYQGEGD